MDELDDRPTPATDVQAPDTGTPGASRDDQAQRADGSPSKQPRGDVSVQQRDVENSPAKRFRDDAARDLDQSMLDLPAQSRLGFFLEAAAP